MLGNRSEPEPNCVPQVDMGGVVAWRNGKGGSVWEGERMGREREGGVARGWREEEGGQGGCGRERGPGGERVRR